MWRAGEFTVGDYPQTVSIVELAYSKMRPPLPGRESEDETWRRWSRDDGKTKLWWLALVGTDNCKGAVFLLTQHANEVGRKEVGDIWTRWRDDDYHKSRSLDIW